MFVSLESRQKGSPGEVIAFPVIPSICVFQQFVMQAEGEAFFFFPESFWVLSLSAHRGEKALVSSPTSQRFAEERLHLTGMDSGELRMFQNIGLYRSRVLGSLFTGTEESQPSENLFPKFLGNIQKGRAETWTKGSFPFIHLLLIVRTQDRYALSSL